MAKQTIEECCNHFLTDTTLKNGMMDLLLFFKELKMKPSWYHTNSYKCDYKKKRIIMINMGEENWVRFRVNTTNGWYQDSGKLDNYLQNLPTEAKNDYVKHLYKCYACHTCAPGYSIELLGELHENICKNSFVYSIDNPTPEQFEFVKRFIIAQREYISNFAV